MRNKDARPEAKAPGLRVGFTVSRALGGAVQRNRIKRRMREAVRLSNPPVDASADVVINPKKSVLTADFEIVLNEVRRVFVVIEQKLKTDGNQHAEVDMPRSHRPMTAAKAGSTRRNSGSPKPNA